MLRSLLACFCLFVMMTATSAHAAEAGSDLTLNASMRSNFLTLNGPSTKNPGDIGYALDEDDLPFPKRWEKTNTFCKPCETAAAAYDQTMQSLMSTRYWIAEIESRRAELDYLDRERWMKGIDRSAPGDSLSEAQAKVASEALSYRMGVEDMESRLPALKDQEASLKALSDDLLTQLENCEDRMCPPEGKELIKDPVKDASVPFDWVGPYPSVCIKCEKLANRLNELPGLYGHAMSGLEAARADQMFAEMEILAINAEHDSIGLDAVAHLDFEKEDPTRPPSDVLAEREELQKEYHKKAKARLAEMERKQAKAQEDIAKFEADLDAITKNFNDTLALYNDCVKMCEPAAEPAPDYIDVVPGKKVEGKIGASCYAGLQLDRFTIGPNAEYGTGAQMKNKAKDMATGAAMGALGKMIGGGGISLGGGGAGGFEHDQSGGGSDGPKTFKNPLGSKYDVIDYDGGWKIGTQAGFGFLNDADSLLVSQKIFDSPDGNSTFHSMWLQDEAGKILLPKRYWIYSIYVDHKLTVWWTYDHWTNGEHDYHDEGEESTMWRTNVGNFRVFEGPQGAQNSIWYQSGFDTGVKGVKEIGAEFDVGLADLYKMPCGAALVTNFTLPSLDPVVTEPFATRVWPAQESDTLPLRFMTEPLRF